MDMFQDRRTAHPRRLRFFTPAQRYCQSYRERGENGELTRNYVTDGKRNRILEVK